MSGDLTKLESENAFDEAKTSNRIVVLPESNQIQIDIDNSEDLAVFHSLAFALLQQQYPIERIIMFPSKSTKKDRWHITVNLSQGISNTERILVQACLGSDRKRELLSYFRELKSDPHPTLFIEEPNIAAQLGMADHAEPRVKKPEEMK